MIRFCDKEVACILENQLDRQQLLEYFMNGHRSDIVCVLDEKGKLIGSITYLSLLGQELEQSVNQDYILLDENAWKEGRKCLDRCIKHFGVENLVPVTDKERNLLCFAYEDLEADQELRMLDELKEYKSAVGFCDLYPQYEHVTVHGCNELAYQFVCYLTEQNISVNVTGELWENFETLLNISSQNNNETLDYKTLDIYSEGTYAKDERIELRPSVSPEFECIDKIYEANILNGVIHNAKGSISDVLNIWKERSIAVLGTDIYALNAYDFLIKHGIDIRCFVTDKNTEIKYFFGKSVLTRVEAANLWEDIIFIQADKKNSAWGFGETNHYHCLGFERNKRFYFIRDYVELEVNGAKNLLEYRLKHMPEKLVMVGDVRLCFAMWRALLESLPCHSEKIVFCDVLKECENITVDLPCIQTEEMKKEDFYLLLLPKYHGCNSKKLERGNRVQYRKELKSKYEKKLLQFGIEHVSDYPFEDVDWLRLNELKDGIHSEFRPKKIILGAINAFSGNYLFEGIMDGHPAIIKMRESILRRNMYSYCVRLSMEPASNILQSLWEMYKEDIVSTSDFEFPDKNAFNHYMKEYLAKKDQFTSQELFVVIHMAYAKMLKIKVKNISDLTIYWEPHCVDRYEVEHYAKWLDAFHCDGYIVNIVRNSYMRSGSNFAYIDENRPVDRMLAAVYYPEEEKKEYEHWQRIVIRFEDLKLKPEEQMHDFCEKTGIAWSDTFLDANLSFHGVVGFDPAPAYRTWENYFSSFDRFRICVITEPWQKKYGYPYVSSMDFSRRELQELFLKKFRFEENWDFDNDELENEFWKWRQQLIYERLRIVRYADIVGK